MSKLKKPTKLNRNVSDIGNYIGLAMKELKKSGYPLSFLKNRKKVEVWRKEAKSKVFELLSFEQKNMPLKPKIEEKFIEDGLVIERISYALPYGRRTKGLFMYPVGSKGTLPAVVALLRRICDEGRFQIVLVTHRPELADAADVAYRFELDATGATQVMALTSERERAAQAGI